MGNTQSQISEEQKYSTLSNYFEYVYSKYICCKRSDEEMKDLKVSLKEMVNYIATELGNVDSRFSIQRTMLVGSMSEGTSIGDPNEFDFLLVSNSLSMSNEIEPIRECREKPGSVHLVLKQNASTDFINTWLDVIKDGKLRSTKTGFFTCGIRDRFRETLEKGIGNLKKELKIMSSTGTLVIYDQKPQNHGPASMIKLLWKPSGGLLSKELIIHVDITFAIKFAHIPTLIKKGEVECEENYRELQNSGSFMTITEGESTCSYGFCHRLTFTNTEVEIMAGLSYHHKKCYRILKYIFNGIELGYLKNQIFHSYAIKTYILKHRVICSRQANEQGALAMCIMDVLEDIEKVFRDSKRTAWYSVSLCLTAPSIFLSSHNIFQSEIHYEIIQNNMLWFDRLNYSIKKISELKLAEATDERLKMFRKHDIYTAQGYFRDAERGIVDLGVFFKS